MTSSSNSRSSVAIVMRSKNEMPHAARAIRALKRQNFQDFTLYNVDSGSTDGTLELLQKVHHKMARLDTIEPWEYIPGKVLNEQISRTTEPYIVLLNADAVPVDEYWLERLLDPILQAKADACMSKQIPRDDAYFIVKYDYLRAYRPSSIKGDNSYFFSAVACAFKRELWEGQKFYTEGYSEDVLWSKECQKQGYRFQLVESSIVEHSHNYTLSQLFRRQFIEAEADVLIYDLKPAVGRQMLRCAKDLLRDVVYAFKALRPWTTPYNILYRWVSHIAYYKGAQHGYQRHRKRL